MEIDIFNIIFAAAPPTQNEFLYSLSREEGINWSRVNAFHKDEYVGWESTAPQCFGQFLKERIFGKGSFNKVYYINGKASDPALEGKRYADFFTSISRCYSLYGNWENTHIAFNYPHEADF